jgi:hypothetical protein
LDSIQNFVFDGIYITEEFKNSYDNQRLVKYLIFNNLLDHRVSFEIIERMSIFQYIGYNYDFIAATGIGGDRLNLGTAGTLHVNLGIQIKL